MKNIVLIPVLCLLGISCISQSVVEKEIANYVVVIFKDAPAQASTKRFIGTCMIMPEATLQFLDTRAKRINYAPCSIGYDTLVVPAYHGYAEISHRNQAIDDIRYLLMAGDTVMFTYGDNLRPQIRSLTSERNTWLYNLPYDDKRAVQPVGYSTRIVLSDTDYTLADMLINRPKKPVPAAELVKYKRYYINLDSLRPIYQSYIKDFNVKLDSLEKIGELTKIYTDYYRRVNIEKIPGDKIIASINDSLMHYISNYDLIFPIIHNNKAKTSAERFDIIAGDTTLPSLARKAMLYEIMSLIESGEYGWHVYPEETVAKYRERYQKLTGDSQFRINVIKKDNIVTNGYSTDLVLKGLDGKQYDYGDILARHKGKVIYVDLWASWCGPCRAGMPDAKKLREAYKGKNVIFLYLAVGDTEDAWKGAVRNEEMDYLGENYRVLNSKSQFFKEIKHGSR